MEKVLKRFLIVAVLLCSVGTSFAAEGKWRKFSATALEYNTAAEQIVTGREFSSNVKIYSEGPVHVLEIKNYITGNRKHDVLIRIAVSQDAAGSIIYNGNGDVLMEYNSGVREDEGVYSFELDTEAQHISARWFISDDSLMSDYRLTNNADGRLAYQETVIYSAKQKTRR